MRNSYSSRGSRKTNIQWKWIIGSACILFGVLWLFNGNETSTSGNGSYITVSLEKESIGVINTSNGKKKQITKEANLYSSDASIVITNGSAKLSNSGLIAYMDVGEASYGTLSGSAKISLTRGRLWMEPHEDIQVNMKNLQANIRAGDVILVEQLNPIYSILYVLKGEVPITSGGHDYILSGGKRIMISQSDLANSSNTLDSLAGPIDDAIKQNPFFIAHGGESLLENIGKAGTATGSNTILTGSTNNILSNSGSSAEKIIEITNPIDGSTISTNTVTIEGNIFSKNVKKITFNDKEALISPVNQSFTVKDFPLSSETTDIVYKAQDGGGNILVKSVLTIKTKNKNLGNDKLVPTTFNTGDKNYRITSPSENPFRTTDETITVSGIVPKNTVNYITVNNYRLRKYIPGSGSWYYFAGINNDTMKEGFNLYEIKFFDTSDTLLSSQVFTIIKDPKGSISGEVIR